MKEIKVSLDSDRPCCGYKIRINGEYMWMPWPLYFGNIECMPSKFKEGFYIVKGFKPRKYEEVNIMLRSDGSPWYFSLEEYEELCRQLAAIYRRPLVCSCCDFLKDLRD